MSRPQAQPDPDDALPPRLGEDLSALYPIPRVPPSVDARVLNQAAAAWAGQARRHRLLRWGGAGAAAAAAVLVVAVLLPHHRGPTLTLAGDVDGSGRVDILDAFSLARQIRDFPGKPPAAGAREDVNGDGVVDEKDVDLIARMAVRASPGGGQ